MNFLHAIVLGIIEGATEFLPISSTFHLIWSAKLLGLVPTDFSRLFEVFIQAGAVGAVVFLYFRTIISDKKLMLKVFASFIPTAVVGLLLYKVIKQFFFNNDFLQLAVFLIVGLIFILYEKFGSHKDNKKGLEMLTYTDAIVVGLVQALAVIPGVSRAGAVILGLMFLKVRREEAAKYSFLLAIPTIFAASALDLFKMRDLLINNSGNISLLLVGTIAAFISAMLVVKWLIKYLQGHSLANFGWYRIAVFTALIFLFVL